MKYKIAVIATLLFVGSCAPKLSFTWTKPNYETTKYKKVAIFSSGRNLQVAMDFQDTMVEYLADKGITAVSGMSILNPMQAESLKPEQIKSTLLKEGVDAVISVTLVDKDKSMEYVQGTNMYMYGGYGFGGYYGYRYGPGFYDPGYYSESTTYLLENHFYEIKEDGNKEEALVWASQSEITDPSKSITKTYSKMLVNALITDGIIQ
ncbi:hypothetical protein [Reichenbachiella sp.]